MSTRILLAPENAAGSGAAPLAPANAPAAPNTAAPANAPKPADPPADKPPPSSEAWASLAKKEKALTEQSRIKAAEYARKEAEITAREAKAKEIADTLAAAQSDPDKFLALGGWDYDKLAKAKIGAKKTPEQEKAEVDKALAAKIQALEDARKVDAEKLNALETARQDRERAAQAQAYRATIGDLIKAKPTDYELLTASGEDVPAKVFATMETIYQRSVEDVKAGKRAAPLIPDPNAVLAYMVKDEQARLEKLAGTGYFKGKFAPVAAKPADKPAAPIAKPGEPKPNDEVNRKPGRSRQQAEADALKMLTEGTASEQTPGALEGNSRKAKFAEALKLLGG